jgi:hypothetical protein
MVNHKADRIKSIGTAIIIALFLLLISSFSDRTQINPSQNIVSSEFHVSIAVIADAVTLHLDQKFCLPLHSSHFSDNNNAFADNKKINRSYILLQKTQLSIKPLILSRFYYHFFSNDTEDLPILS